MHGCIKFQIYDLHLRSNSQYNHKKLLPALDLDENLKVDVLSFLGMNTHPCQYIE